MGDVIRERGCVPRSLITVCYLRLNDEAIDGHVGTGGTDVLKLDRVGASRQGGAAIGKFPGMRSNLLTERAHDHTVDCDQDIAAVSIAGVQQGEGSAVEGEGGSGVGYIAVALGAIVRSSGSVGRPTSSGKGPIRIGIIIGSRTGRSNNYRRGNGGG